MASQATAGGGELSIRMPAAAMDPEGGEMQRRASAAAKPEKRLNCFVRCVATWEWAANAFGTLAFLWATVVLLGGFCTSLNPKDFWFATVIIFIEAFRIFSRSYTLDNRSLFGTMRAVRWISSSFARTLVRPQEGNKVVLIMSLYINLVEELVGSTPTNTDVGFSWESVAGILKVALLALMTKLKSQPRRCRQLQLWAVLIITLPLQAYNLIIAIHNSRDFGLDPDDQAWLASLLAGMVTMVVAILLLNLRPRCVANGTSSPCGRLLLSSAKVTSAVWLAFSSLLAVLPISLPSTAGICLASFSIPFTTVVLSLGSLQKQDQSNTSLFGPWIDAAIHVFFLFYLVFPIPFLFIFWTESTQPLAAAISSIILLVALLIGNLQIPVAVVQVLLSSWRFHRLLARRDYYPLPKDVSINMVPALEVFYGLALCQGSLYIMACIMGLFSFFFRRSLVHRSKFSGQPGAKAIGLYYQDAYTKRMNIGVLSAGNAISLVSFAVESLRSSSGEVQLAGVIVLDSLLQESESSEELISRITSSDKEVSILIAMLGWTAEQDRDIRLFAARVTAKLAGSLRIARIPGMVKLVSSLLDAEPQPAKQDPSLNGAAHRESNNRACSWVCQCWQRMKERWSIPQEPPSTHQNSFPVLGMVILEKLAHDHDNCAEIFKATNLISKITGLISYITDNESGSNEQHCALICSSLNLVRKLATTGEEIGAKLRRELWKNPFLLDNLAGILEDSRSSPEVWEPAMDIIAKLALGKGAGKEIGRIPVIIGKLLHAFLGRDGTTNNDPSLRKVAGEALANLALWGTANCSAILEEPGYAVIKDLRNMLCEEEYRDVTASLLQNLCAHCRVKLSHPDASEHVSSALTTVMEHIMAAEGKQLESLIDLAWQIGDVIREAFVRELESQTNNGAGLVQKLVGTLNSNKKPNPEYPRMRRVVVNIVITILDSCSRTVEKMIEEGLMEGLMEALTKIERTPSKVENYRVFYGNIGVVLENGSSLPALAAKAKGLISAAPTPSA